MNWLVWESKSWPSYQLKYLISFFYLSLAYRLIECMQNILRVCVAFSSTALSILWCQNATPSHNHEHVCAAQADLLRQYDTSLRIFMAR